MNIDTAFQTLNDYFDNIYVLTLSHSVERQQSIERDLKGLNYSFFFGFDKKQLDQQDLRHSEIYCDKAHRATKRTHRSMNLGEVACAISHKMIYEDMLANKYKRILVFEDDVLPIHEELAHFSNYIKEVPEGWELLMLGYYGHKLPTLQYKLQSVVYSIFKKLHLFNWETVPQRLIDQICMSEFSNNWYEIGKVLGAHSYAINRSLAEKYIQYQTPVILQADRVFNYYKAQKGTKAFAPKKPFFTLSELNKISYIQNQT